MGASGITSTCRTIKGERGTTTYCRSPMPYRDSVCTEEWNTLGDAATGNGLWVRDDLLAKIEGVARNWSVGEAASKAATNSG